jgi:hypothetical protein
MNSQVATTFLFRSHSVMVPLDVEAPAELELASDRREPARQPLLIGERVPEVSGVGVINAARDDGLGGLAVALEVLHHAAHGVHMGGEIEGHGSTP